MKKLIPFVLIAILTISATVLPEVTSAQFKTFTFDKTTTSSGADVATGNANMPYSSVASFTVTITKVSGTVAGKVYIYGSNKGNTYTVLDSATVTNTTGAKDYDFNVTTNSAKFSQLSSYKYRVVYDQTGGVATVGAVGLLRGSGK